MKTENLNKIDIWRTKKFRRAGNNSLEPLKDISNENRQHAAVSVKWSANEMALNFETERWDSICKEPRVHKCEARKKIFLIICLIHTHNTKYQR